MISSNVGQTVSLWMKHDLPVRPPLQANHEAEVCVIGAGIAGLTTAYLLAKQGKSVVVLDAGNLAAGMTIRTTAHLSNAVDDRYYWIERVHGHEGARLAADSHSAAIDTIERVADEEGIDCNFSRLDGYLFLAPGQKESILDDELEASHRAGLTGVQKLGRAPLKAFDTGPCLRFPGQGQFHPGKYVGGLMRAIERMGGELFSETHVRGVEGGKLARITTDEGHVVTAGSVVVATNTPFNDRVAIHTKQAPYITYAIAAKIPPDSVECGLYWDTLDAYHYVRLDRCCFHLGDGGPAMGDEFLIVGGEDHKTGQADDSAGRWARLEQWARERFPMVKEVAFHWSGQVMETVDGLAFIGRNPGDADNVYIATGDSGMGMTHGTIAGLLISDLILGRTNPWAELYDPSRKRVGAMWQYLSENLNAGAQYTDWLTGSDVGSVDQIQPGKGAVVRRGLTKVAVYRDEEGHCHECSAVCPHLGGIVTWNDSEKTWDCPVHGSRFDPYGRVEQGPAPTGLEAIHQHEEAAAGS